MIWIIAIILVCVLPWPMALFGGIGYLLGDVTGLGIGLFFGLLVS